MSKLSPAPGSAEHPSLALVNTIVTLPGDVRADALDNPEAATQWLVDHDLVPDDTHLLPYCQNQLTGLRASLRHVFTAKVHGMSPEDRELDAINNAMQKISSTQILRYDVDLGFYREASHPVTRLVEHAMAVLSDDAATLLAAEDGALLAQCEAAPCDRFYLRTHARRRWCSTRCGDRVRAARAYARRR